MRSLIYVLTFLSVIGLAFWAYRENYQTQAALTNVEQLHRSIGQARETLGVLKAEWAYLNRPDRLRELADLNYERLALSPFTSERFGRVDQIAYPVPATEKLPVTQPIDLSSAGGN
jgi:hypothetical protein